MNVADRRLVWYRLAIVAVLIALCSLAFAEACSPVDCTADAAIDIDPAVAALGSVPNEAGVATSSVLVSGEVTNTMCGVHGVSVLSLPATSTLTNFAAWTAIIPLSVLENQPACLLDGGANGVLVTAQASVPNADGGVDLTMSSQSCLSLAAPTTPASCLQTDCAVAGDGGPPTVQCQLPTAANLAANIAIANDAVGQPITWRSVGGLVTITPSSTDVHPSSEEEASRCQSTSACNEHCGGTASATIVGASGATGIDFVTANVASYASPAATLVVAVQGPAAIAAVPSTVANNASVLVTVHNQMGFAQTCTFALPIGIQVTNLATSGTQACPLPDAGSAPPCLETSTFSETLATFSLGFLPGLADSVALPILATPRQIAVVCHDQFNQTSSTSITATWQAAATDAGASDAPSGG
jgi:hypothetical protein